MARKHVRKKPRKFAHEGKALEHISTQAWSILVATERQTTCMRANAGQSPVWVVYHLLSTFMRDEIAYIFLRRDTPMVENNVQSSDLFVEYVPNEPGATPKAFRAKDPSDPRIMDLLVPLAASHILIRGWLPDDEKRTLV